MNEEKRKLIKTLNITKSDFEFEVTEKVWCAALIISGVGIDIVNKVVTEYNRMRKILREV